MARIALDLSDGHTRRSAASRAGISPDTFYAWLRGNRRFAGMVERATAIYEDHLVQTIWRAVFQGTTTHWYGRDGDLVLERRNFEWEAAAWLLEHHPTLGRRGSDLVL